ncbi:alpha/beta hydrolase-fold protein [Corynebacterium sp. P7202]|uniref:Alpha/beta hydrolase-fold protein n=1 Tax=Corynebacterium pygosceleis TaxID=2800406 RepID=A0A9Q4GKU1_9CORY|nr:alpha/beta fold hydrolase [Corynebacterium pygosceleis]MCK7637846.1 alpha/beta hydrolase-fold protein [Corynebacterium pygosceleis]MCX7444614.1 alpha/beta hydrolase-fold protein [Corynebacterium pygosceleis]MCX7468562.1 alpha/beta hydrolase-fold protein [Corynebacterium pygosceleis]
MSTERVQPGTRPFPIRDNALPPDTVPDDVLCATACTNTPRFVPHGDGWALVLATTQGAPGRSLYADVSGITDRSRLEAGLMRPHPTVPKVRACVLAVPPGWRGSVRYLPVDGDDPTVPKGPAQRTWWKNLVRGAFLPEGEEIHHSIGPATVLSAPDATTDHATGEGPDWPSRTAAVPAVEPRSVRLVETGGTGTPLVVFDGPLFHNSGAMTALSTLDVIPSHIAFIIHGDGVEGRNRDLLRNDDFTTAVLDTVSRETGAPRVVVAGSSYGGLGALYAAATHPDSAAGAIALSTPFSRFEDWEPLRTLPDDIRIVIDGGELEWLMTHGFNHAEDRLRELGVNHIARRFVGGHDIACWRGRIAEDYALIVG